MGADIPQTNTFLGSAVYGLQWSKTKVLFMIKMSAEITEENFDKGEILVTKMTCYFT